MEDNFIYTLKNMGIYDLRNYARSVGVAKPTTLKRQELIDAILDIKTGIIEPTLGISRGRKPKNKETATDLFSKYNTSYIDYKKNSLKLNSEITTNKPKQTYVSTILNVNETTYLRKGIAVITENESYFITDKNEKVIIPNFFVKKYDIKNKEEIDVTCTKNKDNTFVVVDVFERKCVQGTLFEDLKVLSKTKNLTLKNYVFKDFNKNYSINCGQCVEVKYNYKVAPEKIALNLLDNFKDSKYEVFSLLTDEFNIPEILEYKRTNLFLCLEDINDKINKVNAIISSVKDFVQSNQDCVLILGNISLLVSAYKEYYILQGNSEDVANTMAIKEIISILALSRQTESGSITIFVLNADNNIEELKPLINARLSFDNIGGYLTLSTDSFSIY